MESFTPWLVCCGIFGVLPLGAFGLGFYFGKYGVEIKINHPGGTRLFKRKGKDFSVDEG